MDHMTTTIIYGFARCDCPKVGGLGDLGRTNNGTTCERRQSPPRNQGHGGRRSGRQWRRGGIGTGARTRLHQVDDPVSPF